MQYSYIKKATYRHSYVIHLLFEDGKEGDLDLSSFAGRGGVYAILKDPEKVSDFQVCDGVLTWGELDLAPESVYHLATGEPLPSWME